LFSFSVAGVLKSILQVFFGLFVFDRFSININTIIGIGLSLVGGTLFSYLEYTSKQNKLAASMNNIDCEQQAHQHINPSFNIQEITTNSEKFVHISIIKNGCFFMTNNKSISYFFSSII